VSKLPDVNLLVAMSKADHPHHQRACVWRKANARFTTCAITELGLVRVLIQLGTEPQDAFAQLKNVTRQSPFIPCDLPVLDVAGEVKSHRQTTDAYLAALAKSHKLTLCTFDEGIKGAELVA